MPNINKPIKTYFIKINKRGQLVISKTQLKKHAKSNEFNVYYGWKEIWFYPVNKGYQLPDKRGRLIISKQNIDLTEFETNDTIKLYAYIDGTFRIEVV